MFYFFVRVFEVCCVSVFTAQLPQTSYLSRAQEQHMGPGPKSRMISTTPFSVTSENSWFGGKAGLGLQSKEGTCFNSFGKARSQFPFFP